MSYNLPIVPHYFTQDSAIKLPADAIRHNFLGDIEIHFIGDTHIGSRDFVEADFVAYRDSLVAKPNAYVCLMGDLTDNVLKSSVGDIYEATLSPNDQRKYAAELLFPLAKENRILGAVGGNHGQRSKKDSGLDPDELICEQLGIRERYSIGVLFIRVDLTNKGKPIRKDRRVPNYIIGLHHGRGGGRLKGSGINKLSDYAESFLTDLFVMGHTHAPSVGAPLVTYIPNNANNNMTRRETKTMVSTGWLDYRADSYPSIGMLKPTSVTPNYAVLSAYEHKVVIVN